MGSRLWWFGRSLFSCVSSELAFRRKWYEVFLLVFLDEPPCVLLSLLEEELKVQVESRCLQDFHAKSSPHCREKHFIKVDIAKPIANQLHVHDLLCDLGQFGLGAEP